MSTSSHSPKEPLPLPPLGIRAESEKTSWAWRNPPAENYPRPIEEVLAMRKKLEKNGQA